MVRAAWERRPRGHHRTTWATAAYVAASGLAYPAADGFLAGDGVAGWFPPAALALAYLVAVGPLGAPVVLLVRLVAATALMREPFGLEDALATGLVVVAVDAAAATWLRRRLADAETGVRAVTSLVTCAIAASASAAVGATGWAVALGPLEAADMPRLAVGFLLGDASAILLLGPALLLCRWPGTTRDEGVRLAVRWLEAGAMGAAVVAAAGLAVASGPENRRFYVTFLPLTWVALRRGLRATTLVLAVTGTVTPLLALRRGTSPSSMAEVQLFMVVYGVAGLLLAATETDRRAGRAALRAADVALRSEHEAARRAEQHVRLAFEAAPIGMALLDFEGRFLAVNPALCAILRRDEASLVGTGLQHVLVREDLDAARRLRDVLVEGTASQGRVDCRWLDPEGRTASLQIDVSTVRDQLDRPSHCIAQIQDVTDHLAMVESIRAAEAMQRASLDAIEQGVALCDLRGNVQLLNRAGAAILGYGADELTALVRSGAWETYTEDGAVVPVHRRPIAHTMRTGERVTDRIGAWRRSTGELVTLRVATEPVHDEGGGLVGVVTAFADITAQRIAERERLAAEQRLRDALAAAGAAESELRRSFEQSAMASAFIGPDGRLRRVNEAFCRMVGAEEHEVLGTVLAALVEPEDRGAVVELGRRARTDEPVEVRFVRGDGSAIWGRLRAAQVRDADGAFEHVHVQAADVTEARAAEEALVRSEQRFAALVERSADVIFVTDADGCITYLSPSGDRLLEGRPADRLGTHAADLADGPDRRHLRRLLAELAARPGEVRTCELRVHTPSGRRRLFEVVAVNRLDEPAVRGIVANLRDITDRAEASARLQWQAYHDPLTGLPNRSLLQEALGAALDRAERRGERAALLYLDLDRFKLVNDTLGHDVGDQLLIAVAARLAAVTRADDLVARMGGDEFVVLLADGTTRADAIAAAQAIVDACSGPLQLDDGPVTVSASVGVAFGDRDAEALLRDADTALYRAKEDGRCRLHVFDDELRVAALRRVAAESLLRRALDRGELAVRYQPVVDLTTGGVIGAEALLRVPGPGGELQPPGEFISVAEESGLIVTIGAGVLDAACRTLRRWQDVLPSPPRRMAVNVSPRQLASDGFAPMLERVLGAHRLRPDELLLELTENVLIHRDGSTTENIEALHRMGVSLAIDDFGTGYSSLAYLQRFPIDVVKIDRSFVAGLGGPSNDTEIVRAVASLGRSLGIAVIAEGVETQAQLAELRALRCDAAQGYLLAHPAAADDFDAASRSAERTFAAGSAVDLATGSR